MDPILENPESGWDDRVLELSTTIMIVPRSGVVVACGLVALAFCAWATAYVFAYPPGSVLTDGPPPP